MISPPTSKRLFTKPRLAIAAALLGIGLLMVVTLPPWFDRREERSAPPGDAAPRSAEVTALASRLEALAREKKLDEAVATAERLRTLEPRSAHWIVRLSELEERRGDRPRAAALAAEAKALDPGSLEVQLREASLLRGEGLAAEADDILRAALRSHPDDPRLNALYAWEVELAMRDFHAAEARVERLVERTPSWSDGWRLLGEIRERAGRPADAARAYRDGLARDPDDGRLHASLGLLLIRGGPSSAAEAHLGDAVRLGVATAPVLCALAACLAERGLAAEAERAYEQAIALDPKDPIAPNNRALAWLDAGRVDDARRELTTLAARFPNFPGAPNNLAAIAIREQRWPEAEKHARRALGLDEHGVSAWNNLGIALDEQRRDREAEAAYRRALTEDATYWRARLNLAILMARSGRAQEAMGELEEVLRQVPGQPDAALHLGHLHASRGDAAKARLHFQVVLESVKSGPLADDARKRLAALKP